MDEWTPALVFIDVFLLFQPDFRLPGYCTKFAFTQPVQLFPVKGVMFQFALYHKLSGKDACHGPFDRKVAIASLAYSVIRFRQAIFV